MVAYIKSDLEFILKQIKIAEDHALSRRACDGDPRQGICSDRTVRSRPTISPGACARSTARTTTCSTRNGALPTTSSPSRSARSSARSWSTGRSRRRPGSGHLHAGVDNDGPGTAGPSDVFDPYVRTISNLIVDQTLGNPSAILTGAAARRHRRSGRTRWPSRRRSLPPTSRSRRCSRLWATPSAPMPQRSGGGIGQPGQRSSAGRCRGRRGRSSSAAQAALDAADDALDGAARRQRHRARRRQRRDHQRRARRRPVGAVQLLVHAVRPVLRSRPRPRRQGRQRHRVHPAACRTIRSTIPGSPTNFMVLTRATVGAGRRRRHGHGRRYRPARSTRRPPSSTRTRPTPRIRRIRCSCASTC